MWNSKALSLKKSDKEISNQNEEESKYNEEIKA